MLTYQTLLRTYKLDLPPAQKPTFPATVEISVLYGPAETFGGHSGPIPNPVFGQKNTMIFNSNTGSHHWECAVPMPELEVLIESPDARQHLKRNEIKLLIRDAPSLNEVDGAVAGLAYLWPTLMTVALRAAGSPSTTSTLASLARKGIQAAAARRVASSVTSVHAATHEAFSITLGRRREPRCMTCTASVRARNRCSPAPPRPWDRPVRTWPATVRTAKVRSGPARCLSVS